MADPHYHGPLDFDDRRKLPDEKMTPAEMEYRASQLEDEAARLRRVAQTIRDRIAKKWLINILDVSDTPTPDFSNRDFDIEANLDRHGR